MHPTHLFLPHETSRLQLSGIADRKFFVRVGTSRGIKSSRTDSWLLWPSPCYIVLASFCMVCKMQKEIFFAGFGWILDTLRVKTLFYK